LARARLAARRAAATRTAGTSLDPTHSLGSNGGVLEHSPPFVRPARQRLLPSRPRRGCAGCLLSLIGSVLGSLALAGATYSGIVALLYPWAYHLGGGSHWPPEWRGWGKLHASSGEYALFVEMSPWMRRETWAHQTGPSITGRATLCAPHGQRFQLQLGGGFLNKHIGSETNGEPMHLYAHYRPVWYSFDQERRPSLEFWGNWQNPNLVLEDRGTLAAAFLPDGRVYRGPPSGQPRRGESVALTLASGNWDDFNAACSAIGAL
jgi:hypothetical protein